MMHRKCKSAPYSTKCTPESIGCAKSALYGTKCTPTHAHTRPLRTSSLSLTHTCMYTHRPATNEAMKIEGTVLLLSLFDHTVIGSDDFIGTCVVACKDIPISSSDGVEQKNLTLPIFRFIDLTYAMAELEFRADCGDAKASGFLRSNIKKALSYLPRPRSGSRSRRRSKNSVSYLEDSNAVQL